MSCLALHLDCETQHSLVATDKLAFSWLTEYNSIVGVWSVCREVAHAITSGFFAHNKKKGDGRGRKLFLKRKKRYDLSCDTAFCVYGPAAGDDAGGMVVFVGPEWGNL